MTPADTVISWRREIEAELQENSEHLARGRAELERAETAYAEARSKWAELHRFVTRPLVEGRGSAGMPTEGLAGALHSRLQAARDERIREIESHRGRARVVLRSLEERRPRLLDALSQLDRMLAAERVVDFPTTVMKRHFPPVDFDTIVPAAERA